MDKRKLKFRNGLHKNLIGSQISTKSGICSETKTQNDETSKSKSMLLSGKTFSSQSKSIEEIFQLKEKLSNKGTFIGQNKLSNEETFTNNNKTFREETSIHKSTTSRESILSHKRKLLNLNESENENDDDLGFPLAESTVLKKRRDDSNIVQEECENVNSKNSLNNSSIILQKNVTPSTQCKFTEFLHESGIKINLVAPHILCKY